MGLGKQCEIVKNGGIKRNQRLIWEAMFKLNRREFKAADYVFNYTLDTDGVSACILLIRSDLYGKKTPKRKAVAVH